MKPGRITGGNLPGGNLPGGGGNLTRGQFTGGGFGQVEIHQRATYRGDLIGWNSPGGIDKGGIFRTPKESLIFSKESLISLKESIMI